MRAPVGCVGGLGVLTVRSGCNPTQGAVETVRYRNYACLLYTSDAADE